MMVRPDEIIRTGSIQPFNVVSQNPVTAARHEIDPFIQSIRSQGSSIVTLNGGGGLGIINPEVIRTISGLGQDTLDPSPVPYADFYAVREQADKYKTHRFIFGAVGVLAGVLGTYAAVKLF